MKNDYQFPMRINASLAKSLNDVSKGTGISKTKITQISLEKFLTEFNESGIPQAMQQIQQPKPW